jgi:hypothetical protein
MLKIEVSKIAVPFIGGNHHTVYIEADFAA